MATFCLVQNGHLVGSHALQLKQRDLERGIRHMTLGLIIEVPTACIFPSLAILLSLRIQEHHLAMRIDALSLCRSRIQSDERGGLVVHLLKKSIYVSIVSADIRIILRIGHVLEDGEVLNGLEKHCNQLLLQLILKLDDLFFLNVILVLEHLAEFKPLGKLLLVILEILVKAIVRNKGKEMIPAERSHLQGFILLLTPDL